MACGLAACLSGDGTSDRASRADTEPLATTAPPGLVDVSEHPIVFASDRTGSYDLWLMRADGSDSRQLTGAPSDETHPAWSSDGTRLAFRMSKSRNEPSDLYVMNADGTATQQLTDTNDSCESSPSWSPDDRQIMYTVSDCGSDEEFIFLMDSDGADRQQLVEEPVSWPDWSPDGGRIVYTTAGTTWDETRLVVSDTDGSNRTVLDTGVGFAAYEATWSPDGRQIAFVSPTGSPTDKAEAQVLWNEDIFVMNADGTRLRRVVSSVGNDRWPPAWSPDGRQLVYSAGGTANVGWELMSVDLVSLRTTQLTHNASNDLLPTWAPETTAGNRHAARRAPPSYVPGTGDVLVSARGAGTCSPWEVPSSHRREGVIRSSPPIRGER
jgi:Tol biopolymer transport system component